MKSLLVGGRGHGHMTHYDVIANYCLVFLLKKQKYSGVQKSYKGCHLYAIARYSIVVLHSQILVTRLIPIS